MIRNRLKLFILVVISFHLHFCVNYVSSFYTQRQRYASRMLKITPKECHSPDFPDLVGICMLSLECNQKRGTVIGACRSGHLFGACCKLGEEHSSAAPSSSTTTASTTPSTTTTTTTTTTPEPTTTTTTTTTTEEPTIINNDISSDDLSLEADSTAIPSLIDTFSELSPTFLSELALDEHTTGIYTRGEDLLPVNINNNNNANPNSNRNQVSDDEDDGDSSALNNNSESSASSTESASAAAIQPVPMTTFGSPSPPQPPSSLSPIQNEIGGLAGFSHDPDFKDNMIKYIDEIVTMRSNNDQPPPPPVPSNIIDIINPDVNEIPFSTFTIISSTKATESSSPVVWSWTTTSGSDNNELSTSTTEQATTSTTTTTTEPTTSSTTTTTTTTEPPPPPPPPSSTFMTYPPPSSTERYSPYRSEEILSVSVSQSINDPYLTNDIFSTNDIISSTETSTTPWSSSENPSKFTFSKLKYSPRPYKPRSTTEKVVWTRPPVTTPEVFESKPLADMDPEDDDMSVEEDEEPENILSSAPSTISSTTEDPPSPSTEMMMTTSTEGSPSPYSYMPYSTGYANDDVNDGNNENVNSEVGDIDDDAEGYIQGHYYAGVNDEEVTSTTEDDPSSFFYTTGSSSTSPSSLPTGLADIDWTSPTVLSYLKGVSESFENLYYGNGSRSDLNGLPLPTAAANEITSPSSAASADGYYGSSSTTTDGFTSPSGSGSSSSWYTTGYSTGASGSGGAGISSTMATSPSSPSSPSTTTTTGFSSSSSVSPSAPSTSLWDSSIDSFVDQVVEGIVHDLNKSNKIDEIIFNNTNDNKKGSAGTPKKKKKGTTTTTGTTASANPTKPSKVQKMASTTPAALKLTSIKNKLKSALEKAKFKTTSIRPFISSTKSPAVVSTTQKEKIKIKVKVPGSKTRTNKNKVKPVKKVTTVNSPHSTRKRLNYKRDCGVRPLIKRGRIVGGTPSRFGSWPWHALVKETVWWGIFSKIKCGGVLIGPQHVLTAAHCQPQQTGTLSVVLGITDSDDTDSRAITKTVKRIIPHPQFNPRTYENDIAILELESPIDFQPHIVPICLPRDDDELEGKTAYVTGMGLLKHDGERPLVLQEVDLPILNNSECQKMFIRSGNRKPIIESFICAGYEQGRKDSCGGDSGGPLSVKRPNGQWVLAGTVSHGIKCALPDQPGVYMRTSYYRPWIDRVLNVSRSRYRGIHKCNAPPLICARQRHHQQLRQQQQHTETGLVNTLFRIFRLARKMVEERRSSG